MKRKTPSRRFSSAERRETAERRTEKRRLDHRVSLAEPTDRRKQPRREKD